MLISDVVAQYLAEKGIEQAFVFTGGSIARLLDSIGKSDKINYTCNLHEQASAMSADAYARISKKIPVVAVTSGPGATNLVTGCAGAYYDSVPILFITGQVSTNYLKGDMQVRQYGFQETDVISIFSGITKYVTQIKNPEDVLYEIDKAIWIAVSDRKGPVLIDIPEDIQRMDTAGIQFRLFQKTCDDKSYVENDINNFMELLMSSMRPTLVLGQGVHQSDAENNILKLINKLNIPVVHSSGAMDLLAFDHKLNYGNFGIYGHTSGNSIVQNSDLIIVIGSRLDHHMTGKDTSLFAPGAKKILIEIDNAEIQKFERTKINIDLSISSSINTFVEKILQEDIKNEIWNDWCESCQKEKYIYEKKPLSIFYPERCFLNISKCTPENAVVIFDTGCSLIWGMQYFRFKIGQRCISQFNHTSMGYAIPAAIGAAIAEPDNTVVCISGDGGFQLNIQELATIVKNNYNIKMIVFDNSAYALMLGSQNSYMDGRHIASTKNDGIPLPCLENVIRGYGLDVMMIQNIDDLDKEMQQLFKYKGPMCCLIKVEMDEKLIDSE